MCAGAAALDDYMMRGRCLPTSATGMTNHMLLRMPTLAPPPAHLFLCHPLAYTPTRTLPPPCAAHPSGAAGSRVRRATSAAAAPPTYRTPDQTQHQHTGWLACTPPNPLAPALARYTCQPTRQRRAPALKSVFSAPAAQAHTPGRRAACRAQRRPGRARRSAASLARRHWPSGGHTDAPPAAQGRHGHVHAHRRWQQLDTHAHRRPSAGARLATTAGRLHGCRGVARPLWLRAPQGRSFGCVSAEAHNGCPPLNMHACTAGSSMRCRRRAATPLRWVRRVCAHPRGGAVCGVLHQPGTQRVGRGR